MMSQSGSVLMCKTCLEFRYSDTAHLALPHEPGIDGAVLKPETADHDMDVDISGMIFSIWMSTDQCPVSREIILCQPETKGLGFFRSQTLFSIRGCKGDNVLMGIDGFGVTPFPEPESVLQTQGREGLRDAVDAINQIFFPWMGLSVISHIPSTNSFALPNLVSVLCV